ncbi:unnamed protein product [Leptosia nina]|uniref:RanBD1 domain-containing protein n=1 Tax=Leptosia nina TaxID=320188 RepID=A0AAV1JVA1_9NEOP
MWLLSADAKQGKQSEEVFNSSQTRIVLAKPKLGGFGASGFASSSNKGSNTLASVLRPPQLKTNSNPFAKVTSEEPNLETEKKLEAKPDDRLQESKEDVETPKFVPLGSANVTRTTSSVPTPATTTPSTSSAGFVFGQNLSERVVMKEALNNGEKSDGDHSSSNGTNDLLFTSAAATVKENHQEDPGPCESRSDSLAEAAAEYERSHARPPPATSNCTVTGEEDETNVLQISCRLFAWEAGSWRERGRGVLRLNDTSCGGARVVARVAGSLRVVLNTKLWPDMVVERAGTKSLRITAADAQLQIKLFLIMGAPDDIAQLHRALQIRVARSKSISISKDPEHAHVEDEGKSVDVDDFGPDDVNEIEDIETIEGDKDSDRLEANSEQKTETDEFDNESNEEKELKALKRKEPAEDTTSPKRQCPDVQLQ